MIAGIVYDNDRPKGKGLDSEHLLWRCLQTRDQQRLDSEVAADWHEPMTPYIARYR